MERYTAFIGLPHKFERIFDLRIHNKEFVKRCLFRNILQSKYFPFDWSMYQYKWSVRFILEFLDEYLTNERIETFAKEMEKTFYEEVFNIIENNFTLNLETDFDIAIVEDGIEVSFSKSKVNEFAKNKQNIADFNKLLVSAGRKKTSSKQILSDSASMFCFMVFMEKREGTIDFFRENYNDIDVAFIDKIFSDRKKAFYRINIEDVFEDIEEYIDNFIWHGNFKEEFERLKFQRDEYLRLQTKGETPERIAEIRQYTDHNFRIAVRELMKENEKFFADNDDILEMDKEAENED